jgi:hypothetical protein
LRTILARDASKNFLQSFGPIGLDAFSICSSLQASLRLSQMKNPTTSVIGFSWSGWQDLNNKIQLLEYQYFILIFIPIGHAIGHVQRRFGAFVL